MVHLTKWIAYQLYNFITMGLTNSQSVNHRGNSLPVLAKNYALHAQTSHNAPLRPRSLLLLNISRKRFEEWQRLLSRLQRCNEYLFLPRECVWRTSCVCSQFGEVEIQYQDGIYTLKQEIEYRSQREQYFQEGELWHMLLLIINLQFRVSQNEKEELWNIHPESIVVSTQGHIKILVQLDRGEEGEGRQFVPPEEIPLLLLKLIKSTDERVVMRINKNISETFQLGLTLLSAARLRDCQALYTHSPLLTLDLDQLSDHLEQWRQEGRYTEVFAALVANLCSFNPAHRLSGPQLWEWITDHSAEIKGRSAFSFKYLPRKISQLVATRIRDSQQGLLRSSRLKMENMEKMGSSQVECRFTQMSPRNSSMYEKHLYQPIHHIGKHAPPMPKTRTSQD